MEKKLSVEFIKDLSKKKNEPSWMLDFRLKAYQKFMELDLPNFGPELKIDFDSFTYYKNEVDPLKEKWEEVRDDIRNTFCNLGVIDAEEKYLGGVTNQYESEVVYHHQRIDEGVIFTSTDEALKKYPELFRKYFNNLVKYDENKFTALNGSVWSGGSFIYVPKNVHVSQPLQSYFRIDSENLGQFERTIIIVDEGASLEYIEGCTAPSYSSSSLHAGVVEIYVMKNAKCRYSTIQNWSTDVLNLVTKRAIVEENGLMEWVDGNIGSLVTMKYPCSVLKGDYSRSNSISIAYSKNNQVLDAGAKMIHIGKNTKSNIISKSISKDGGTSNYRGTVRIGSTADNSKASVRCDTILLDEFSKSDTFPTNIVNNATSSLTHEAYVTKVDSNKITYLKSKGLSESEAKELILMGFIGDFKKELPMEYAVELNRLLKN